MTGQLILVASDTFSLWACPGCGLVWKTGVPVVVRVGETVSCDCGWRGVAVAKP